ncbi:MAG: hypothetical protein M1541_11280, partial [Acidobacteria bacterium]|nr:hypothetical protein [Acidobacteriota bacterium]
PARKALDDMRAWGERGVAPVAGTEYSVDEVSQIVLPRTARLRKGYQPVVVLSSRLNKADAGFTVAAEDPDNEIVRVEMDWEGDGKFEETREVRGRSVKLELTHHYEKSGTYYPVARVTDSTTSVATAQRGIQNLATVQVVVP